MQEIILIQSAGPILEMQDLILVDQKILSMGPVLVAAQVVVVLAVEFLVINMGAGMVEVVVGIETRQGGKEEKRGTRMETANADSPIQTA